MSAGRMAHRVPNKGKTVLAFKTLSQTFFLRGEEGYVNRKRYGLAEYVFSGERRIVVVRFGGKV
jgi:hypothetical protein